MASDLTAQNLLWQAHKQGIAIRPDRRGNLVVSANGSSLVPDVRRVKPQLLAITSALDRYDAADDALILEALALFNAEPTGLVTSPSIPFPAPVRLPGALEPARNTHTARQATFWKE